MATMDDYLDFYTSDEEIQSLKKNLHKCSYSLPTIPQELNDVLSQLSTMLPQQCTKLQFTERPVALGFTSQHFDLIRKHCNHPLYEPDQKTTLFKILRRFMLLMMISCSECKTIHDLIEILEEEVRSGVPSKAPSWYWLTLDCNNTNLSQLGYKFCHNEGCFKTESQSTKFLRCGQCKVPFYCSKSCQISHWKRAHKKNCDKEALFRRQTNSRRLFVEHCLNSGVSINRLDKDCLLFYRDKKNSFNADAVMRAIQDDPQGRWNKH